MLAIITEAIWLIRHEGIPASEVFAALDQIKEVREAMTRDPFTF